MEQKISDHVVSTLNVIYLPAVLTEGVLRKVNIPIQFSHFFLILDSNFTKLFFHMNSNCDKHNKKRMCHFASAVLKIWASAIYFHIIDYLFTALIAFIYN